MKKIINICENRWVINLTIVLGFAILTIFQIKPFFDTHTIFVSSDFTFHASRVQEIYDNLKQGSIFTFIATHTFQNTGVGNFLFYPTVFLYPWAILKLFFSATTAFFIWYGGITFLTFINSYISVNSICGDRIRALVFSILYTYLPYRLYLGKAIFGEYIAVSFVPLVFWGLYEVLCRKNDRWCLLGIGYALIAYSHLLSVVIITEVSFLLFIFYIVLNKGISLKRFVSIIKSVVLFVLLISFEIAPFITDYVGKNIYATYNGISFGLLRSFSQMVSASFNMSSADGWSLGFIIGITLFVGVLFLNSKLNFVSYLMFIILAIISTSYIIWSHLNGTPFSIIQLPVRYLTYAGYFGAVVASLGISRMSSKWYIERKLYIVIVMVLFLSAGLYIRITSQPTLNLINQTPLLNKTSSGFTTIPDPTKVNNKNYDEIFNYMVLYGETDYYPIKAHGKNGGFDESKLKAKSIIENRLYVNGKETKYVSEKLPNKITYKLTVDKNDLINLPIIPYKGTVVSSKGQRINYKMSSRGTIRFRSKTKIHKITVEYKPSSYYFAGIVISFAAWVYVLVMISNELIKRRYKNPKPKIE